MLYFIGLGLSPEQLTQEAKTALKNSQAHYVEYYTSRYADSGLEIIEKELGIKFTKLYRGDVEENFKEIINKSTKENVAFCIFGNITSATTHSSLIEECIKKSIEFKLIPGISIFSVIPMLTGLQEYRFGRTITVVKPEKNYSPDSFFQYILDNKEKGLHTLCLLDIKIDKEKDYFMQPYEAGKRILEIANIKGLKDAKDWDIIIVSGAFSNSQLIYKTKLEKLENFLTDIPAPSSIIICGKLQMDEKEFINTLDKF
jgi:diphthine synthase